jgi:hypothetical protein
MSTSPSTTDNNNIEEYVTSTSNESVNHSCVDTNELMMNRNQKNESNNNDDNKMGNVSHSEICIEEELTGKSDDHRRPSRVCVQPLRVMSFNIRLDTVFDGKNAWKHRKE